MTVQYPPVAALRHRTRRSCGGDRRPSAIRVIIGPSGRVSRSGVSALRYRQGDILDRDAVDALVADVDVVVCLGLHHGLARGKCEGESGGHARRVRGHHAYNPTPITEDTSLQGSPQHYYSEPKAACGSALREIATGTTLEVFALRPCIVAGPKAAMLADAMPWRQLLDTVRR
jgi:UDP-glucose 4-epimerase